MCIRDSLKSVDQFNAQNRDNRFGGRLEPSKFNAMVDSADNAISGTTTQMSIGQNLDKFTFGNQFSQCLDFSNPIVNPNDFGGNGGAGDGDGGDGDGDGGDGGTGGDGGDGGGSGDGGACKPKFSSVKSGTFYATGYTEEVADLIAAGEAAGSLLDGTTVGNTDVIAGGNTTLENVLVNTATQSTATLVPVNLRDDGLGNMMMVTNRNEKEVILNNAIGTVDYNKGIVCVGPLDVADTPDGTTRIPVVVLPSGGSIIIPAGVDPTLLNPRVFPRDTNVNPGAANAFDPFNFNGWNCGGSNINTISYPAGNFTYPELDSCF